MPQAGVQAQLGQLAAVGQELPLGVQGIELRQQLAGFLQGPPWRRIEPMQLLAEGIPPLGQLQGQR